MLRGFQSQRTNADGGLGDVVGSPKREALTRPIRAASALQTATTAPFSGTPCTCAGALSTASVPVLDRCQPNRTSGGHESESVGQSRASV